jgi:hypothetical protein
MAGPPLDVFTAAELPRFRRAAAEGRYDHARAVFVGPRPLRCGCWLLGAAVFFL